MLSKAYSHGLLPTPNWTVLRLKDMLLFYHLICFVVFDLLCSLTLFCFFYNSVYAETRFGRILRFPRAADEPPRACALRGLT